MQTLWSNSTLMWDEQDLVERDALVHQLVGLVKSTLLSINHGIKFRRVETPILTPEGELQGHLDEGFPVILAESSQERSLLRPETTAGCVAAFETLFPQETQRAKVLPFCVWQFGKSFRDETNSGTMRATRLRLMEFHQLEFELFASSGTKADYITGVLNALTGRFGGEIVVPTDLPHYSRRTLDWEIDGVEVAGCSERTDWKEGTIYEVSIGIERLLVNTIPGLRVNF